MLLADDTCLDDVTNKTIQDRFPFVDIRPHSKNSLEIAEKQTGPRTIKTHLPYRLCKEWAVDSGAKVVVPLRNPKDTLVSLFNMHRGDPGNTSNSCLE